MLNFTSNVTSAIFLLEIFFVRGKIPTPPKQSAYLKIYGFVNFKAKEKFIKQHF